MATKKHRITVSLTDQQYLILSSISSNTGQPMSYLLVDMLESALPVYEKMAVTFDNLKKLSDSEKEKFVQSLARFQQDFEPIAEQVVRQSALNLSVAPAVRPDGLFSEPAKKKKPSGAATVAPRTNRGVTPPTGKPAKPKPRKASKAV